MDVTEKLEIIISKDDLAKFIEVIKSESINIFKDEVNKVPIFPASVLSGATKIVHYLLESGCDINYKSPENNYNLLQLAVLAGEFYVTLYLINRGLDVNSCDDSTSPPLVIAIEGGVLKKADGQILGVLLMNGADVDLCIDKDSFSRVEKMIEFEIEEANKVMKNGK